MFTDRQADNQVNPTELDWIVGLAVRWWTSEVAVYLEQDQPLERAGLVQKYVAIRYRMPFDLSKEDLGIGKVEAAPPPKP